MSANETILPDVDTVNPETIREQQLILERFQQEKQDRELARQIQEQVNNEYAAQHADATLNGDEIAVILDRVGPVDNAEETRRRGRRRRLTSPANDRLAVRRRRIQDNAGQNQRQIDDLNLSDFDDELDPRRSPHRRHSTPVNRHVSSDDEEPRQSDNDSDDDDSVIYVRRVVHSSDENDIELSESDDLNDSDLDDESDLEDDSDSDGLSSGLRAEQRPDNLQPLRGADQNTYRNELELFTDPDEYHVDNVFPPNRRAGARSIAAEVAAANTSVVRENVTDEFGDCTMCFEAPSEPMGCTKCKQLLGCKTCVNHWYLASVNSSGRPGCPLCRAHWRCRPDVIKMATITARANLRSRRTRSQASS